MGTKLIAEEDKWFFQACSVQRSAICFYGVCGSIYDPVRHQTFYVGSTCKKAGVGKRMIWSKVRHFLFFCKL